MYHPERFVFLAPDPVFLGMGTGDKREPIALLDPQSQNSYLYARGNPINLYDPNGEFWETLLDIISIALSLYDYNANPSFVSGLFLALDVTGGVTPGVPSAVGYARHGVRTAKIAKYFKEVAEGNINTVVNLGELFAKNIGFKFSRRGWSAGDAGNDVANFVGHFEKHRLDNWGSLGAPKSVDEYHDRANNFLDSGNYKSWSDSHGGTTFYKIDTGETVFMNKNKEISSYFIADPNHKNHQYARQAQGLQNMYNSLP